MIHVSDENKIKDAIESIINLIHSKDLKVPEVIITLINLNSLVCINTNVFTETKDVEEATLQVEEALSLINTCSLSAAKTAITQIFNEREKK